PAPGWLAESIMDIFVQEQDGPAAANLAETSAGPAGAVPPPRSGQHLRRGTGGPGRHRISRPLASVVLTGGLVAGSAVAALAPIGAHHHTPAAARHPPPPARARAGATPPPSASAHPPPPPPPRAPSP